MNIKDLEQAFADITKAYENGELKKDEYADLLKGLEAEGVICETAEDLERKTELNKYINTAITAATLLA